MQFFWLKRTQDISGTSGTGIVAEGVIFSDGECVMHWLSDLTSVAVYKNIETLERIHGHNGSTTIVYGTTEQLINVKEQLKKITNDPTPLEIIPTILTEEELKLAKELDGEDNE